MRFHPNWYRFAISFMSFSIFATAWDCRLLAQGTLPLPPNSYPALAPPAYSPHDSIAIDPLLVEYANSQDDRKKQILEQITKLVQQEFNQRHSAQQQEIKWLEDQLAAKKKAFDKRESLKEKIVNDRVASLIQRADGIGWEPLLPSTPPNPFPPAWTPNTSWPNNAPFTPYSPAPYLPAPNALPGIVPPVGNLQPTSASSSPQPPAYPKAWVSYEDFKELVAEVESHRNERILSLDEFLAMSKQPNVIVLDTRSDFRYDRIHIQGAKHLSFTDFTQTNLANVIPTPETTVLIYCNNNFDGNQVDFASKSAPPRPRANNPIFSQVAAQNKPVQLALNVPTYINLYGYGYRNVYELGELVKVTDPRIQFEGTMVGK